MTRLVFLPLALAGFGLFFAPLWFRFQSLPLALLGGVLGALLFFSWAGRLLARAQAPWALERQALWLIQRRGSTDPAELAEFGGVPEPLAEEVLDGLVRRGLARKDRGRYRR